MNDTTPSPETAAHLDLDALADVLADQAAPEHAAHLAGCASCTSRLAELEAAEARVVSVLSTLPPPAVPDDLADRIDAALAAEIPLRPARASVTALPAQRRRSFLPAAAAAVLLVSGAGLGWSLLSSAGGSDDSTTAAALGPEVVVAASGTDYADPAAVTAALPQVLTTGEVTTFGDAQDSSGGSTARSNEDSALAEAQPNGAEGPATTMSAADPLDRLRTPDGLASCLAGLQAGPDEAPIEPLAVDFATYGGAPALAVVLLDPDPDKLSIFVVGPGCSQPDANLLHFVRVDAP